jgi:putative transposase
VKTFQYRIYPTKKQERALEQTLSECRWLYNHFLEDRKTAWEERQESVGLYDQLGELPALKRERSSLTSVHSQVLQNVGVRIDLAFAAFFRRVRNGESWKATISTSRRSAPFALCGTVGSKARRKPPVFDALPPASGM